MTTSKEKNHKSMTLKLSIWAFVASLVFISLGIIEEITIGDKTFKFRMVDAAIIFALIAPTLGAYVGRRYTDHSKK